MVNECSYDHVVRLILLSQVLFPMLARLLEVNSTGDPMGVEETRMRAATLLCKVFQSVFTLNTKRSFALQRAF